MYLHFSLPFFLLKTVERWEAISLDTSHNDAKNPEQSALKELKQRASENRSMFSLQFNANPKIEGSLSNWIQNNMSILSESIYHRDMYNQVAVALFGLFSEHPDLWRVIPYLSRLDSNSYSGFRPFIMETIAQRIPFEVESFPLFVESLTGERIDLQFDHEVPN